MNNLCWQCSIFNSCQIIWNWLGSFIYAKVDNLVWEYFTITTATTTIMIIRTSNRHMATMFLIKDTIRFEKTAQYIINTATASVVCKWLCCLKSNALNGPITTQLTWLWVSNFIFTKKINTSLKHTWCVRSQRKTVNWVFFVKSRR